MLLTRLLYSWYSRLMNTHELAWAAGLFDGEGHTRADFHSKSTTTLCPRIDVAQSDRFVLDRFRGVVGVGRVYGPYARKGDRAHNKPKFNYIETEFEPVQAIIAMIWRWLSPMKREQAKIALRRTIEMARVAPGRQASRPTCKYGHPRTPENIHTFVGRAGYTYRQCRACSREKMAKIRARKKLAEALLSG